MWFIKYEKIKACITEEQKRQTDYDGGINMKQVTVKIGNVDTVVTVVDSKSKKQILTANDIEMDTRAEKAVKAAIQKAKICNKPVARYDAASKSVTLG